MRILFFVALISFSAVVQAIEINRILFSLNGSSWTKRDYQVFDFVLNNAYKRKKISKFSSDELNDFLLSRMASREAETFEITFEKQNLTDSLKKKSSFSPDELEREIETVGRALAVVEIKESHHQEPKRFNAWFEVMRRKYQVKIKSVDNSDIKSSVKN
jgi:hypothetical protein